MKKTIALIMNLVFFLTATAAYANPPEATTPVDNAVALLKSLERLHADAQTQDEYVQAAAKLKAAYLENCKATSQECSDAVVQAMEKRAYPQAVIDVNRTLVAEYGKIVSDPGLSQKDKEARIAHLLAQSQAAMPTGLAFDARDLVFTWIGVTAAGIGVSIYGFKTGKTWLGVTGLGVVGAAFGVFIYLAAGE
jgi:hypothetical protein